MQEIVLLRVVVRLFLPFILMYGLYILLHSQISPGGGFQAGIIWAAAFMAYSLVNDLASLQKILPQFALRVLSSLGIFIYIGVGLAGIFMGGKFLDYSVFKNPAVEGGKLGVMLIECAISMVVFSFVMLVFYLFGRRSEDDS